MQLQSYVLHRDTKVNIALTGYCRLYNTNHTERIDNYVVVAQPVFLTTAIIFLWLIIAIRVPAALYSVIVIPINSGQSLTTKQTSTSGDNTKTENNQTPMNEDIDDSREFTASTVIDRREKQALYNIKESNYMHSLLLCHFCNSTISGHFPHHTKHLSF